MVFRHNFCIPVSPLLPSYASRISFIQSTLCKPVTSLGLHLSFSCRYTYKCFKTDIVQHRALSFTSIPFSFHHIVFCS